ncbi:MAG: glycosyltransferase, partial [Rubrivivax sp.]|nr:glycosyltransferase [Rubrivivax sp.]
NAADQPQPTATLSEHLQQGIALPRYEGLKMGLPAKAALTRLWTRQRPDVVQIATEGPLGWSALAAANKLRLPVASDFHTNFHSYSSHYGFGLLRLASRLGDGVFWYALMGALIAWLGWDALPAVLHMIVAGLASTRVYK